MGKRKAAAKNSLDEENDYVDEPVSVKYIKRPKEQKEKREKVRTDRKIQLQLASGDPLTKLFIEKKEQLKNAQINFVDKPLPYGDVWFVDITDGEEELLMVWERKTQADLENSIKSEQHWALQRDRMLEANVRTVLVIEGYSNEYPLTETIINYCIEKHGIFPLRTKNIDGSFIKACQFYKDLSKGTELKSVRGAILKYGPKEQTAKSALALCVSMVHQVTRDMGMAIQEKYPNMKKLIQAFLQSPDPQAMLAGISYRILPDDTTIVSKNAPEPKIRKIPLSTSRRIYYFLCEPERLAPGEVDPDT